MRANRKIISACLFIGILVVSCEEPGISEAPIKPTSAQQFSANETEGAYTFNGSEGDLISLETANRWIARFKDAHPTGTQAHFFGHEIIQAILAQDESIGIRIYYGIDDAGNRQLMLVGATSDGSNIIPSATLRTQDGDGIIGDASFPCPTYCNPPGGSL